MTQGAEGFTNQMGRGTLARKSIQGKGRPAAEID